MSDRKAAFAKRQRELEQKERTKLKAEKKAARRAQQAAGGAPGSGDDIDPDLIGIVPGPQPRPEDDVPFELAEPTPTASDDVP